MDDIGSKPLPIVEAAEGLRGASCIGDIPPVLEGRPGPGPGPIGGPGNLCPGLGTGKRLDETMGDLGPDAPPGLGAGNFESG